MASSLRIEFGLRLQSRGREATVPKAGSRIKRSVEARTSVHGSVAHAGEASRRPLC